jgi:phage I-like protein
MNIRILNRAGKLPDDGWYQFEVPGEHINEEAGVIQVIDPAAIDSIVNRAKADAAQPNFGGILVDRDHFSLDLDKPSEAMGWAQELRNRDGTPEARVEWTPIGQPLVAGKSYKFFSTVYEPDDVQVIGSRVVNGKKYRLVRPLHLSRLALTNDPNNKGGKPISNRTAATTAETDGSKTTMNTLLKKLGLAEGASEESAVAAVETIQNRATTAEAKATQLQTERDGLLAAQVDTDLEKFAPVIKNREAVKKQLLANRASTLELLESLQAAGPERKERPAPITNRQAAATPGAASGNKQAEEDGKLAARISNRALEIQKQKSARGRQYPYQTAFNDARNEIAGQ